MEDMFQVGIITAPHGVKGEVKVFPTTDDNKRFKKLKECFIEYNGELMPVKACGCKFFKNMVILKFEDFDNMDDIIMENTNTEQVKRTKDKVEQTIDSLKKAIDWETNVDESKRYTYHRNLIDLQRELENISFALSENCSIAAFICS